MDWDEITDGYRRVQQEFIDAVEALDGTGRFGSDVWERPGGGGGDTRILQDGRHIAKGAVNFSAVWGDTPARLSERLASQSSRFRATGVSIIVHPVNPYAPTFHANIRYFETDGDDAWFGGGADLTPHYLFEEDARHFHRTLRDCCERHPVADHAAWKRACDEYFHLGHRGEARGIGGIFFDHLTDDLDDVWRFQLDLGSTLAGCYVPVLERRVETPWGPREEGWLAVRHGRYVEFNLVWDRGTRFGLETGGRTESILASLPPRADWRYDSEPDSGTPEAALLTVLRGEPRDWAGEDSDLGSETREIG